MKESTSTTTWASPSSAPATGARTWSGTSLADPDWELRVGVRPRRGAGPQRARAPRRRRPWSPSYEQVLDDPDGRGGRDRDAGGHPHEVVLACARGRQARAGREAAGHSRRRGRASWSSWPRAGLVLMCDHTYCYTPAVQQIRELIARGRARRHPVRRLGAHQPRARPARRRRVLGPRPARPVDPRLHPPRRTAPDRRSRPTAPTRSAPARRASAT